INTIATKTNNISVFGNVSAGSGDSAIFKASKGNLQVFGNITASDTDVGGNGINVHSLSFGNVTVYGNVTGGKAQNTFGIKNDSENVNITATGNITGGSYLTTSGSSEGIYSVTDITIYGNLIQTKCFATRGTVIYKDWDFSYIQIGDNKYYASSETIGGAVSGGLSGWVW
nr:hypothetical protein [Candidatus ainarchaeum sp.]